MKYKVLILAITFILNTLLYSAEAESPRTTAAPFWTDAGRWIEPLTPEMIILASLHASGVPEEKIPEYEEKFTNLTDRMNQELTPVIERLDDYQKGEFLLKWVHSQLLSEYSFNQTRMDILLDTGVNNCVSSSILYLLLGRILNLEISAVETRDHVFCSINTESGLVDVETTTIYGFDPGTRKEFADEFDKTGFSYVPPGNYRQRTTDSDRELIALILQNRMAGLQRGGEHLAATALAADRHAFLNSEKTLEELNGSFQNWTAELNRIKRDEEAFNFLAEVSVRFNLLESNSLLLYQLANNHLVLLIEDEFYDEALTFLTDSSEYISDDKRTTLETMIKESRLDTALQTGSYEENLALVRSAIGEEYITERRWRELIVYLHQNEALLRADNSGWREGFLFLKGLPEEEQNLRELINYKNSFYQNWVVEIHNSFVDFYRERNFDSAELILLEGLELDPGNRTFLQDLQELERVNR